MDQVCAPSIRPGAENADQLATPAEIYEQHRGRWPSSRPLPSVFRPERIADISVGSFSNRRRQINIASAFQ